MGILPLQFKKGENPETLKLSGYEIYDILGIEAMKPGCDLEVKVRTDNGTDKRFEVYLRLDTNIELEYYLNGGILQTVLRNMIKNED